MEELKKIKQSLESAEDSNEVIELLDSLQDKTVTLESLKATQLGLVVSNLKKKYPNDKKIVDMSKKLVADWKACVTATSTPTEKSNGKTPVKKEPEVKKEEKKEEKKEVKKEETPDKKRKASNSEEKPVAKKPTPSPSPAPKSPSISDGGSTRDKAKLLLCEALGEIEDGDQLTPEDASTAMEAELFSLFNNTGKDYMNKLRSLSFNLKKNEILRREVLNASLTVDRLCRMTAAEMASEEEQEKRRKTEKWHIEAATIGQMEASTDQFLCGKCKNRKTTYYQLQTRSADEPMTTFVTCTVCGNRWKFC